MKYLVLKPFRAFGKRYERGQIVDESQIRCPRIRVGERKIIPLKAVSSSITPEDEASTEASPQVEVSTDITSDDETSTDVEVKTPVKLSFGKKED